MAGEPRIVSDGEDNEKVIVLATDHVPEAEPERPSPPSRLHGAFTTGMALSALLGIASMFAFITVGWSESTRGYVLAVFFISVLVFLTCASAAVFTAARDTHATHSDN